MGTMFPKTGEVSRDWWLVDLSGQTLGRAASQIASLLRGKHKTIFTSHVDA
ncbi:MAG: uL13 family ribosomal protein, partial [Myxococcales bacterium]|nr:uL13 family ribosomal protein [Myxococcales bacterium]